MSRIFNRILWRILAAVAVLWGAATLTFVALHTTGGDTALAILGGPDARPTPEILAQVRREYGLDQPLILQYGQYLGRLAKGDLGDSYRLRVPVTELITEQVGATAILAFWAAALAILLSIVVALFTAKKSAWLVSLSSSTELILTSIPVFVLGIFLLLIFSFHLRWFPPAGSQGWQSLVLPTLTLALPLAAALTQVLRQVLDDVLEQPFIVTARARGLSEASVRLAHALRHALVPLVTLSGFVFANLFGGAVITESLYARQGLGRLMLDAANYKDIPLVVGITLLAALIYVLVNLVVDFLVPLIDPRVND